MERIERKKFVLAGEVLLHLNGPFLAVRIFRNQRLFSRTHLLLTSFNKKKKKGGRLLCGARQHLFSYEQPPPHICQVTKYAYKNRGDPGQVGNVGTIYILGS
jgi:hypothetical protein